jgi:hypothetical protein
MQLFEHELKDNTSFRQLAFNWQNLYETCCCGCCGCANGADKAAERLQVAIRRVVVLGMQLPPFGPRLLQGDKDPKDVHGDPIDRDFVERQHLLRDPRFRNSPLVKRLRKDLLKRAANESNREAAASYKAQVDDADTAIEAEILHGGPAALVTAQWQYGSILASTPPGSADILNLGGPFAGGHAPGRGTPGSPNQGARTESIEAPPVGVPSASAGGSVSADRSPGASTGGAQKASRRPPGDQSPNSSDRGVRTPSAAAAQLGQVLSVSGGQRTSGDQSPAGSGRPGARTASAEANSGRVLSMMGGQVSRTDRSAETVRTASGSGVVSRLRSMGSGSSGSYAKIPSRSAETRPGGAPGSVEMTQVGLNTIPSEVDLQALGRTQRNTAESTSEWAEGAAHEASSGGSASRPGLSRVSAPAAAASGSTGSPKTGAATARPGGNGDPGRQEATRPKYAPREASTPVAAATAAAATSSSGPTRQPPTERRDEATIALLKTASGKLQQASGPAGPSGPATGGRRSKGGSSGAAGSPKKGSSQGGQGSPKGSASGSRG